MHLLAYVRENPLSVCVKGYVVKRLHNIDCAGSVIIRLLFTFATYVYLLDGDLGRPLAIPQTLHNDAK